MDYIGVSVKLRYFADSLSSSLNAVSLHLFSPTTTEYLVDQGKDDLAERKGAAAVDDVEAARAEA